ncbi:methyltransferase domain-containing protein [Streptomyces xiamenensis]
MSDRVPQGILPFTVPRHAFIPERAFATPWGGKGHWIDRIADPDLWWKSVYSNSSIVTQIDDGKTELTPETIRKTHNFTCSSSAPSLVFSFLLLLNPRRGDTILEIGTGTGWTAALLADIVGDDGVVTIEVDPALAAAARSNLTAVDRSPRLVVGDGSLGSPSDAPFDGVHVTCGVHEIPYAWIEQTRPGGRIILPWMPISQVAALTVQDDGTASGRFHGECGFMLLRSQRDMPSDRVPDGAEDQESTSSADPRQVLAHSPGRTAFMCGKLPSVSASGFEKEGGHFLGILHGGHSHAVVREDAAGVVRVTRRGPRDLWEEAIAAHAEWVALGSPDLDRFGLTVNPSGQHVWLDTPDQFIT